MRRWMVACALLAVASVSADQQPAATREQGVSLAISEAQGPPPRAFRCLTDADCPGALTCDTSQCLSCCEPGVECVPFCCGACRVDRANRPEAWMTDASAPGACVDPPATTATGFEATRAAPLRANQP